jgi:small neutral amino acid transporter SnatA (MarC family)
MLGVESPVTKAPHDTDLMQLRSGRLLCSLCWLTRRSGGAKIHRIIVIASAAVAIFLIGSVLGKKILDFFNVGLDDFRIAGGLPALFIAFEMFQAHYGKLITVSRRDEGR